MTILIEAPHSPAILMRPDGKIRYFIDDFSNPWEAPEVVLMLHGIAEQAQTWGSWVPHFARSFKVVRIDLRGFGGSSALPAGQTFGLADWADDVAALVSELGVPRVHLVATKLGALIAFELAQRQYPWIASMTLAGMLASPAGSLAPWVDEWTEIVETQGVEAWARITQPGRMADNLSPPALAWWTNIMGTAPAATVAHCFALLPGIKEPPNPEGIICPTLFIAAQGAAFVSGSYDQRPPPADLLALKDRVRRAEISYIEANSYHIAATHPDECAARALAFIKQHRAVARQHDLAFTEGN
jgi:pimeloyl-ACP methyl ester carboxylesterase